ncbi:hypothetical protein IFT67_19535 [Sphingomonas sp. CFBP 13728]|uniref:hypothetical protein n=1 Tax=Sphingomonas sp. CFBP 13728 TaxID=2775294 RepID=UPI001787232F|nr:hypothetical protein [Sphingomonas sp. CFBP 13728]MBD8621107.1 hypothetical protein [Sphingomonas sp. CFBP 13728]
MNATPMPSHSSNVVQSQAAIDSYAWIPQGRLIDPYFKLLLLVAPIQSILVTPVQGTTPAFVVIGGGLVILAGTGRRYGRLWSMLLAFTLLYSIYMALSMSGYLIDQPDLSQLNVVRDVFIVGSLRQTHLTQGMYLLGPVLFCYLTYSFYQEAFLKYAYYGILILALYGFYEFVFYAIFHTNGDFLSNRDFGDLDKVSAGLGDNNEAGFVSGSLVQQSNLFGAGFMRLKSLVGEPSMYALTVTPFAVYAFVRRWRLIFGILLLSLFMGGSTTALLGLATGIGYAYTRQRQDAVLYIIAFLLVFTLLYFTTQPVHDALDSVLFEKLNSVSGNQRSDLFMAHAHVVLDGNIVRTLFGLGFGTVRSTDMLSTMLANVGMVGFILYSIILLAPCFLLQRKGDTDAIVGALLAVYFMEMITVPEYAYLPPWFMVSLGFARVRQQRRALTWNAPL